MEADWIPVNRIKSLSDCVTVINVDSNQDIDVEDLIEIESCLNLKAEKLPETQINSSDQSRKYTCLITLDVSKLSSHENLSAKDQSQPVIESPVIKNLEVESIIIISSSKVIEIYDGDNEEYIDTIKSELIEEIDEESVMRKASIQFNRRKHISKVNLKFLIPSKVSSVINSPVINSSVINSPVINSPVISVTDSSPDTRSTNESLPSLWIYRICIKVRNPESIRGRNSVLDSLTGQLVHQNAPSTGNDGPPGRRIFNLQPEIEGDGLNVMTPELMSLIKSFMDLKTSERNMKEKILSKGYEREAERNEGRREVERNEGKRERNEGRREGNTERREREEERGMQETDKGERVKLMTGKVNDSTLPSCTDSNDDDDDDDDDSNHQNLPVMLHQNLPAIMHQNLPVMLHQNSPVFSSPGKTNDPSSSSAVPRNTPCRHCSCPGGHGSTGTYSMIPQQDGLQQFLEFKFNRIESSLSNITIRLEQLEKRFQEKD